MSASVSSTTFDEQGAVYDSACKHSDDLRNLCSCKHVNALKEKLLYRGSADPRLLSHSLYQYDTVCLSGEPGI